jgi:hypothetical protein
VRHGRPCEACSEAKEKKMKHTPEMWMELIFMVYRPNVSRVSC